MAQDLLKDGREGRFYRGNLRVHRLGNLVYDSYDRHYHALEMRLGWD